MNEYHQKPQQLNFPLGQLAFYSNSYPGYSESNGDSLGFLYLGEKKSVILLADGAGGTPGGNQASGFCLEIILNSIQSSHKEGRSLRECILDGIEKANSELLEKRNGACTTLCVLEIEGRVVRPYHIGDSTILVVGQKGKRKLKTIPHSPHGYAVESGLLDESDMPDTIHQVEVSNLLGTKEMRIEMGRSYRCLPRDTILISSDGITDNIGSEEIENIIRKGSLVNCSQTLADMARHNMDNPPANINPKPDDYSLILFRPN